MIIRPLHEVESEHILYALNFYGGVVTRAAQALGLSRKTLYRKIKRLGLEAKTFQKKKSLDDPPR